MNTKMTVAIIFGGVTSEHEVSLKSAASVLRNLSSERYDVIKLGITKRGYWFETSAEPEAIETGEWENSPSNVSAFISPDRSVHGIVRMLPNGRHKSVCVDAVFPVMHGRNGEDGTIQGLFQLAGIPFVGCDLLSSAVCMDKAVANTILDNFGILRAPWALITDSQRSSLDSLAAEWESRFGYPMFVKPANAGSSVGISKAHDRAELLDAVELAFKHDRKVLIERNVAGKELEVSVLGNDDPIASLVGEILSANEFYDYDAKYFNTHSDTRIPADITPEQQAYIQKTAVTAYRALGCAGLSRVDFLMDATTGKIYLNELNTIPGFTSISMYAKMFAASGISYGELLDRLFALALERD
ncbi:MAG: D-alanine--D-alanine ligase family protein [Oscillospiraceae bacterium]